VIRAGHRGSGLGWIFVQAGLLHASYAVVRPMVSYRALDLGVSTAQLGALAAASAFLPLLLAFVVGRQADTLGPSRLLVAGSVLLALGSGIALLAPGFVVLLVASATLGFAHLLGVVGQQTVVARSASETDRDRGFGSLSAAASVGQMLGPPLALSLAGWLATRGWSESVVGLAVAAGLAAVALPLLAPRRSVPSRAGAPGEPTTSRGAFSVLIRTDGMWQAMVTSGMVLAALDLLLAFLPAWAEENGVSVAAVGWLLAVRGLVSLLSRAAVVRLIAVFSRRWTLLGSLLMGVAGFALLPFVDVVGAVLVMCLLGVGLGLAQPLTLSWVSNLSAPNVRGAAIGMRMTANRLAQTVIPPGIGFAVADSGTTGVFLGSAAMLAAACGTILRRRPHEPPTGGS
jgi:predicted MFS family arabinose efflux permease